MTFKALLVSRDDEAIATLARVLSASSIGVQGCGYTEAIRELGEQKFDAVLIDFDEPEQAALVLQNSNLASPGGHALSVALLRNRERARAVLNAGANFVLFKPIVPEEAHATLRAATALIKRERRRSARVPVQVPVELQVENGLNVEGILLDLSEDGMEVLSSQPLVPAAALHTRFDLPDGSMRFASAAEVAWASPNGQTGVRFAGLSEDQRSPLRSWVAAHSRISPQDEADVLSGCRLTDLSPGGCYVETESPFPERSGVILLMSAAGSELRTMGMVRVMHPGHGMGVEFVSSSAAEVNQVVEFICVLASHAEVKPEVSVMPRSLIAGHDPSALNPEPQYSDPLLDLLRSKEEMNQDEFLDAMRKQRSRAATA